VLNKNSNSEEEVDLDLCIYKTMDGVLGDNVLGNLADITSPEERFYFETYIFE
jgi:hypothetical protein